MKKVTLALSLLFLFSCLVCVQAQTPFPKNLTGDQLYQSGLTLAAAGKYKEAVPYFQEASRRKANFAEAYYQLGICYVNLQDPVNARTNLVTAKYLTSDEKRQGEIDKLLDTLSSRTQPAPAREVTPAEPVQPAPAVDDKEAAALLQKRQQDQELEARNWLSGQGIRGSLIKDGFLIEEISVEAGNRTGLAKDDIIVMVNNTKSFNLYELVGKLKRQNVVVPLTVFAGTDLKPLSWPPVNGQNLSAADTRSVELLYSQGRAAQEAKSYDQALDFFSRAASASLDYPCRADIFLDMARVRMVRAQAALDRLEVMTPDLQALKDKEVEEIRPVVDQANTLMAEASRSTTAARRCLADITLELNRANATVKKPDQFNEGLAEVKEGLDKQDRLVETTGIVVANAVTELDKKDIAKWLVVTAAKSWWNIKTEMQGRRFALSVEVTIRNNSNLVYYRDLPVDVKIVDSTGDIMDTLRGKSEGLPPRQDTTLFLPGIKFFGLAEDDTFSPTGQKRVPMADYLRSCRIQVFIGGRSFGFFNFGVGGTVPVGVRSY